MIWLWIWNAVSLTRWDGPALCHMRWSFVCRRGQQRNVRSHRLILITDNLYVSTACQIKMKSVSDSGNFHRYLFRDPIIVIALDTAGPIIVIPCLSRSQHCLPDYTPESKIRMSPTPRPRQSPADIVSERCPAWFQNDRTPVSVPLPNHYPFSPLIVTQGTKGKSDHRNVHLMTISHPLTPPRPAHNQRIWSAGSYQWCLPVLLVLLMIMINTTGQLSPHQMTNCS